MKICVALFRGINVGGKNVLPMKELRSLLEDLGATDVETYIQSGNAVFRSEEPDPSKLEDEIRSAIQGRHGFTPHVLVLERGEFEGVVSDNPFPEAESEPKSLHLFFLAAAPEDPDLEGLESIKTESEEFAVRDRAFYLRAPDGIGRSKLAANAERLLGVPATARNWRTVSKVAEMLKRL